MDTVPTLPHRGNTIWQRGHLVRFLPARSLLSRSLTAVISSCVLFAYAGCNDVFTEDYFIGVNPDTVGSSGTNSAPGDDDGDGLGNDVELDIETESRKADSDHDGFDDGLEFVVDTGDPLNFSNSPSSLSRSRFLDPSDAVQNAVDRDGDGLGDTFESDNDLNADSADTDGDGFADGLELVANSNPFVATDVPERDAPPADDGLDRIGSAPVDSDSDGLSDDTEALSGTLVNDADSDGDGFSDSLEFLMGSDGSDFLSVPNFNVPVAPTPTPTPTTTETTDGT